MTTKQKEIKKAMDKQNAKIADLLLTLANKIGGTNKVENPNYGHVGDLAQIAQCLREAVGEEN